MACATPGSQMLWVEARSAWCPMRPTAPPRSRTPRRRREGSWRWGGPPRGVSHRALGGVSSRVRGCGGHDVRESTKTEQGTHPADVSPHLTDIFRRRPLSVTASADRPVAICCLPRTDVRRPWAVIVGFFTAGWRCRPTLLQQRATVGRSRPPLNASTSVPASVRTSYLRTEARISRALSRPSGPSPTNRQAPSPRLQRSAAMGTNTACVSRFEPPWPRRRPSARTAR